MADTYKGESLSKKVARAWFWFGAMRWLGRERFVAGKHLILASREGGDAAVLKALGVPARNIVAMEVNAAAAAEFEEKHPDVPLFVGDAAQLVNDKRHRGQLLTAHLDFCSWVTEEVIDTAVRVVRFGMKNDSVLSVGVMKGRERGSTSEVLKELSAVRESRNDLKPGRPMSRVRTLAVRTDFLNHQIAARLSHPGPLCQVVPMGFIGYDSGRTPMLFHASRVIRSFTLPQLAREYIRCVDQYELGRDAWALAEETALDTEYVPMHADRDGRVHEAVTSIRLKGAWPVDGREMSPPIELGEVLVPRVLQVARILEVLTGGLDAAAMLTVERGQLAAWRAHETRGSYVQMLGAR